MAHQKVSLFKEIPPERLRLFLDDEIFYFPEWKNKVNNIIKPPVVGDIGELDQCFSSNGREMFLVYFTSTNENIFWEAEAYPTELVGPDEFKA
jgi:hypothetical protein